MRLLSQYTSRLPNRCRLGLGTRFSGLSSTAIGVVGPTSSRKKSRRFAFSVPVSMLTPVALPPGRLRLATSPIWTGSPPKRNDDRDALRRFLGSSRGRGSTRCSR